MNIQTFDDLLSAARSQPLPQRLLFVFAGVELPDDATPAQRLEFERGEGGGPGGSGAGAPFLPDPGQLWLVFRRRLWLFLVVVASVLALVSAYTLTRPVLYSASASVLIEPRQPEVLASDPVAPNLESDTNVIDTEVEILSSRRLAGRVAEALKLETWYYHQSKPMVGANW